MASGDLSPHANIAAAQPASPAAAPAVKKPKRWGGRIFAAGVMVATAGLLGLAVLLFLGIEGNPFVARLVRERIVLALQERIDPALRLSVGAVDLRRQEAGTVVRVSDFTVTGPQGRVLVSAPTGTVTVDTPSLFIFRLIPTEVVLDGLRVAAEISETGALTVAPAGAEAAPATAPAATLPEAPPVERLQQLIGAAFASLAATREAVGGTLPALGIENATLDILDRRSGRHFLVRDIAARLMSAPDGGARARVELKTGAAPFAVNLDISARTDKGQSFAARTDKLTFGDLMAVAGVRIRDIDAKTIVDVAMSADVDRDLKARAARAEIAVPQVQVPGAQFKIAPVPVKDLRLGLSWQEGAERITIDSLRGQSGDTHVALNGFAAPPANPQDPWAIQLKGQNIPVEGLAKHDQPFEITQVAAEFQAWPEAAKLVLSRFEAVGPKAQVRVSGHVATEADGRAGLALDLAAQDSDVRTALRLWPAFAAPPVRAWLVEHLKHGVVNQLRLRLRFTPEVLATFDTDKPMPDDSIAASWHVSRATLQPLPGSPPIREATASGTASGRTVRVDVTGGVVDLGAGRRLSLPEGSFSIADTAQKTPDARVRLRFNGSAEALAELVRSPGLQPYAGLTIDPATLKGAVEGEANIGLRLSEKMTAGDVRVGVNASLKGLTIDKAIGGEKIEAGAFALTVDRDTVLLKGDAKVFGAPASIEVRAAPKSKPRATLSMVLDDATRARKGYGLGGAVTGPIAVKLAADLDAPDDRDILVEADFGRARLDGVIPGWTKAPGQAARAKATLSTSDSGGWQLDDLEFDSGPVQVRGSVQLAADGQFLKAQLPTFKLSSGDNARLDAERAGGVLKIAVKGNSVDARAFLRSLQTGVIDKSAGKDVELALRSTVLSGFNGEVVADANLTLALRAGELKRFDLTGGFDKGPVTTRLTNRPGAQPTLVVASEDAGAFLRFFDIYNRMQGGQLTLGATLASGAQSGTILIKDFVLRNEPAMKRLVADAAAQVGTGDANRIDPAFVQRLNANQDVKFSKMTVEFSRNAGRLTIKEAVIWGPEVGGNIAGYLDYARDRVDLTGTFVPAYSVNNFFAQVPVFGPLLGGGRNEGLFAMRYGIGGKVSAPTLTINPLTAIAPGFLRKIIDFRGAAPPPGSAPAPPLPIQSPN